MTTVEIYGDRYIVSGGVWRGGQDAVRRTLKQLNSLVLEFNVSSHTGTGPPGTANLDNEYARRAVQLLGGRIIRFGSARRIKRGIVY